MKRQVIRIFFKALTETIEKYNILVHHVVLMSNHYHIIATATDKNLDRAMSRLRRDGETATSRVLSQQMNITLLA